MQPETFANVVSNILYEKRFGPYYAEPVVAGLDADGNPYITGMDLIGEGVAVQDVGFRGFRARGSGFRV